jgi:hypothetical protein
VGVSEPSPSVVVQLVAFPLSDFTPLALGIFRPVFGGLAIRLLGRPLRSPVDALERLYRTRRGSIDIAKPRDLEQTSQL